MRRARSGGPTRASRKLRWTAVELIAVAVRAAGGPSAPGASLAAVPVRGGRVDVGDLRSTPLEADGRPSREAREMVGRRFVLLWDARAVGPILARSLGTSVRRVLGSAIDVRVLIDRLEGPNADRSLHAVARRLSVPLGASPDVADDALAIGQLFLVVATKLSGGGEPRRVGELLADASRHRA